MPSRAQGVVSVGLAVEALVIVRERPGDKFLLLDPGRSMADLQTDEEDLVGAVVLKAVQVLHQVGLIDLRKSEASAVLG